MIPLIASCKKCDSIPGYYADSSGKQNGRPKSSRFVKPEKFARFSGGAKLEVVTAV